MDYERRSWLTSREAVELCIQYPKGPKNKMSLKWAAEKAGFRRLSLDGFHWEYNTKKLKRYLEIANYLTLNDIAKQLNTTIGNIKYFAMKYGIGFSRELKRKYLEPQDAKKLIRLYTEHHHGKEKTE